MKSAFTVDLEDWFCSHNLKEVVRYEDWDQLESRVERTTMQLVELLHRHRTTATFFVLGWVAERYPHLIRTLQQEGHEIASHGYAHRQITSQTRAEFEADIRQSNQVLKEITGQSPEGYRAPAFSITGETAWALQVLQQQGFRYDSSIYPFSLHPEYGNKTVPMHIHQQEGLVEVPMSCATFGRFRMPCSGGAYLRFYPFPVFRALTRMVLKQNRPYIFYIHPWELDEKPPRVPLRFSKSLRHYYNTRPTLRRIDRLLQEMEFTSLENLISL